MLPFEIAAELAAKWPVLSSSSFQRSFLLGTFASFKHVPEALRFSEVGEVADRATPFCSPCIITPGTTNPAARPIWEYALCDCSSGNTRSRGNDDSFVFCLGASWVEASRGGVSDLKSWNILLASGNLSPLMLVDWPPYGLTVTGYPFDVWPSSAGAGPNWTTARNEQYRAVIVLFALTFWMWLLFS